MTTLHDSPFSRPPFRLRALVCVLAGLPAAAAVAQTTATPTQLAPVSVTATRTERSIEELPPSVSTTSREQLDEAQADDYRELGKLVPGVDISRNGRYGFTNINIRGLQGNRVLTLVDGIRLPDTFEFQGRDSRVGQDLVDFDSLSSIDIVRGPGSTLYGSSALAGIVGLRTLNPEDLLRDGAYIGGRVTGGHDTTDNSTGLRAAVAGRSDAGTSWLVQVGGRKGHETETGGSIDTPDSRRTVADPQDTERRNVLAKLQQRFDGGHRLGLTAEYFRHEVDTNLLSLRAVPTSTAAGRVLDSYARDEQTRKRVSVEYDYAAPGGRGVVDTASARLYHQKLDSSQQRFEVRGNAPHYERDGQYEQSLVGTSGHFTKRFGGAVTQNWIIGGEWWQSDTEEFAAGFPRTSVVNVRTLPTTKNRQWGIFADNEIGFANGAFTLTPGLRYDRYKIAPEVDSVLAGQIAAGNGSVPAAQEDSRLSPKLAANWLLSDQASLFAQYAYGFRAPSVLEVNGQFTNGTNYTLVPNGGLKPETSRGLDLGARLGTQDLGGTVTVFDTHYRNFIEMASLQNSDPVFLPGFGSVFQYRNVERARIYGTELAGHMALNPNWRLEGFVAWMQGQNESSDGWLDSVPSAKMSVALRYSADQWGALARLTAARAKNKTSLPNAFQAPGYGVVDLSAWWLPTRDVRVTVGLYNLFDRKYWNGTDAQTTALSGTSATRDFYSLPGRNLRATVAWQF